MLAGGDSIEDVDVLRAGGSEALLGAARAPLTIETWLLRFGGGLRSWQDHGPIPLASDISAPYPRRSS